MKVLISLSIMAGLFCLSYCVVSPYLFSKFNPKTIANPKEEPSLQHQHNLFNINNHNTKNHDNNNDQIRRRTLDSQHHNHHHHPPKPTSKTISTVFSLVLSGTKFHRLIRTDELGMISHSLFRFLYHNNNNNNNDDEFMSHGDYVLKIQSIFVEDWTLGYLNLMGGEEGGGGAGAGLEDEILLEEYLKNTSNNNNVQVETDVAVRVVTRLFKKRVYDGTKDENGDYDEGGVVDWRDIDLEHEIIRAVNVVGRGSNAEEGTRPFSSFLKDEYAPTIGYNNVKDDQDEDEEVRLRSYFTSVKNISARKSWTVTTDSKNNNIYSEVGATRAVPRANLQARTAVVADEKDDERDVVAPGGGERNGAPVVRYHYHALTDRAQQQQQGRAGFSSPSNVYDYSGNDYYPTAIEEGGNNNPDVDATTHERTMPSRALYFRLVAVVCIILLALLLLSTQMFRIMAKKNRIHNHKRVNNNTSTNSHKNHTTKTKIAKSKGGQNQKIAHSSSPRKMKGLLPMRFSKERIEAARVGYEAPYRTSPVLVDRYDDTAEQEEDVPRLLYGRSPSIKAGFGERSTRVSPVARGIPSPTHDEGRKNLLLKGDLYNGDKHPSGDRNESGGHSGDDGSGPLFVYNRYQPGSSG